MSGLPLRIAFLWHNHQPYYEKEGEFILPWVRLHAVKDYADLPMLLNEFPQIRQTLNIVPSVFLQIEKYLNEGICDSIQRLTRLPACDLTSKEKSKILELFFICNEENMIRPYWRFNQLFELSCSNDAVNLFSEEDWRDLQVWYNLTWLGEFSRLHPFAARLFKKESRFTEEEKLLLLDIQDEIMSSILPLYKGLNNLGQLEISTTPYFHPILPLLIDFNSVNKSKPENLNIEPNFAFPEDAEKQISMSIAAFEEKFGPVPAGFWPSEGSLSNDTLRMFCKKNIKWVATDEQVLFTSETSKTGLEKFFPRKYKSNEGDIVIYFRDNSLSDKIGFLYSNWHPYDAAANFVHSLLDIRQSIIANYGEEALNFAVVPIILDGENCWEFYPNNGFDFLRSLYAQISENQMLYTVLMNEAANDASAEFLPPLTSIRSGSWINANFDIWAGHSDDISAWNMLSKVRHLYESAKDSLTAEKREEIYEKIFIAEGSDWFWWYGPEHDAPNKPDFDVLFRWHIKQIYEMLGIDAPDEVFHSIGSNPTPSLLLPEFQLTEENGQVSWENCGTYEFRQNFSTMHQSNKPNIKVNFGNTSEFLYFRIINFYGNTENYELEIGIENINFKISNTTLPENKIIAIPLTELQENLIHINLKLINLAEKKELKKIFEYNVLWA
jgi:alpha-amylase/alpha-mannosidase (GH57 family)